MGTIGDIPKSRIITEEEVEEVEEEEIEKLSVLEAEIWIPLGGRHGGPKNREVFFFQF